MKRFFSLVSALCIGVIGCAAAGAEFLGDAIIAAGRHVRACALAVFTGPSIGPAQIWDALNRPVVELVRAVAFVAAFIKRDRPIVAAGWRLCPSI